MLTSYFQLNHDVMVVDVCLHCVPWVHCLSLLFAMRKGTHVEEASEREHDFENSRAEIDEMERAKEQ